MFQFHYFLVWLADLIKFNSSFVVATVGGNSEGERCVLPFTYQGVVYRSCTHANAQAAWCPTTANYEQDKKWGYCRIFPNEIDD